MKSFGSTMDRAGSSMGSLFDNQASGLWTTKKKNFWSNLSNSIANGISSGIKKSGKSLGSAGIYATEKIHYGASADPIIDYKDENNFNV